MIGVYQGEHALVADNRLVGMLQVTGMPPAPAREREIEIAIEIDSDAVTRVIARDPRTRREQSVIITGSPGPAISNDHRESVQRRYAALGEDTARHAATAQLPAAQAALARGEELTFGDITISAGGVRAGQRDPVPWTEISDLEVEHGMVRIKQAGKLLSRRPASKIPNFVLFVTLAGTLRQDGPP
jgi:hypothetical protein